MSAGSSLPRWSSAARFLLLATAAACSSPEPSAAPPDSAGSSCPAPCNPSEQTQPDDGATSNSQQPANGEGARPEGETTQVEGSPLSPGDNDNLDDPTSPSSPDPGFARPASEVVAELSLGWNLGNSLDVPENETAWGNPTVTAELLQAVAEGGFDLVRIPVTWSLHMGPAPDYTVDPAWLARVSEVVQYTLDAGLTAIINLHHDGADGFEGVEWLTLNDAQGNVSEENNEQVRSQFVALWTQLSTHFSAHGPRLWFESMNEIHDGYGTPDPRYFDIVNDLNQAFVDTVRASGGNNAQRYLVVPGYNTNIDHTVAGFQLPTDSIDSHLILSAHYYDPYTFALEASTNTWGAGAEGTDGWGQEDFVVTQFDKLSQSFVEQGIPTILGEYGAVHQAGFEPYRRYYMEYVTKVAADRGIVPVYWDNGGQGSGTENLGLFNRSTNEVLHPDILEAMSRAARSDYALSDVAPPE